MKEEKGEIIRKEQMIKINSPSFSVKIDVRFRLSGPRNSFSDEGSKVYKSKMLASHTSITFIILYIDLCRNLKTISIERATFTYRTTSTWNRLAMRGEYRTETYDFHEQHNPTIS